MKFIKSLRQPTVFLNRLPVAILQMVVASSFDNLWSKKKSFPSKLSSRARWFFAGRGDPEFLTRCSFLRLTIIVSRKQFGTR
ncbi:MAG: hypothetical protein PWP57_1065 [Candidatus Atribacteria bacterium]|nr:hypothetical protein [Candidatus Atribacteria bacterium]